MKPITIRAEYSICSASISLYIRDYKKKYLQPLSRDFIEQDEFSFKTVNPVEILQTDFVLTETDSQTLMDDLWKCGVRPTEGKGSAGSLKATESHLKDMRKIAFKKLGIDHKQD